MMFITLKRASAGDAISINVDHIICITDAPAPNTGTHVELGHDGLVRVVESRAEIVAEITRLHGSRAPLSDADQHRIAGEIAQAEIDAYAENLEEDFRPGFRKRAAVWVDIITDAAYAGLGRDR